MAQRKVYAVIIFAFFTLMLHGQQKVTPPSSNNSRTMDNNQQYTGFMVEGHLGIAGSSVEFSNEESIGYNFDITGSGARIGGKFGYRTSKAFALNGGLDIFVIPSPDVDNLAAESITLTSVNLQGGIRLYLSNNFFLGGNICFGQVGINNSENDYTGSTKWGPGYVISVGNTWWAGSGFGIELEAFLNGLSLLDKEEGYNGTTPSDISAQFYGVSLGFVLK